LSRFPACGRRRSQNIRDSLAGRNCPKVAADIPGCPASLNCDRDGIFDHALQYPGPNRARPAPLRASFRQTDIVDGASTDVILLAHVNAYEFYEAYFAQSRLPGSSR